MFIEVSTDVVNKSLDSSDVDRDVAIETLRELSLAVRRNHHLVFIPYLSVDIINKMSAFLNKNELVSLKFCYKKRRDLYELRNSIQLKCVVSFLEKTRCADNVIYLNPKQVDCFEFNEESHLLTENILDSEFYAIMAKVYQKNNRIDSGIFKTHFFPVQGGGATIKDVYLLECRLGEHFCLCIIDSDKKWPNCKRVGQTAQEFETATKKWNEERGMPVFSDYYIMRNTSEIENLIPHSVLKHFSSLQQQSFITNHHEDLLWLDIKKGLEYKILYNVEAYDEWKTAIPNEVPWNDIDQIKMASADEKDYKQKVVEANLPVIINPWGGRILEKVLHPDSRHVGKYNLFETDLTTLTTGQRAEWLTIGSLIFNWCCCFTNKIF